MHGLRAFLTMSSRGIRWFLFGSRADGKKGMRRGLVLKRFILERAVEPRMNTDLNR